MLSSNLIEPLLKIVQLSHLQVYERALDIYLTKDIFSVAFGSPKTSR